MKKVLAILLIVIVIMTQAFSLIASAETSSVSDDGLIVKTGSDFWINDWNYSRPRSITSDRNGNLKTDYYYNCFTRYRTIKMVDSATYYSNITEPYFILKNKIDMTPYFAEGTMRFWIDVPKDMSLRITLMSLDDSGSFGRCRFKIDLKTADEVENYQKVEIPLSSFTSAAASQSYNWEPTGVRYIAVSGVSNCTAETFLADGEEIKISDIEIWSGDAPEIKPYDSTAYFYSRNGDYVVRDVGGTISATSQVSGFKNTLLKDNYIEAVEDYSNYVSLLEVYTVNIIDTSDGDYRTVPIEGSVEAHIPVSKDIGLEELLVGVISNGEMVVLDHILVDDCLIVTTDILGDILVMDNVIPSFCASNTYSDQADVTVYDNTKLDSAAFVKTEVNTSKYTTVYNESGSTLPELSKVTEWLDSDGGIVRFWVKTPWRENTPTLNLKADLCVLYSNNGSSVYPHTETAFSVPFDGLWHEMRLNSDAFNQNIFDNILNDEAAANTYSRFYFRLKSGESKAIVTSGEGLYISDAEFFTVSLNTENDGGNVERASFAVTGKKQDYVTDVSVATVTVDDNDYVSSAKRITRKETTTDFNGKILLPYSADISVAAGETYNQLGDWFYTKGAEMRTFVKNESDSPVSFKLGIYGKLTYNASTVYPKAVTSSYITIEPNSGWQEIRINFDDVTIEQSRIAEFTKGNGYVALEIYTKKDDFLKATGDSILVAPLEIYSLNIVENEAVDFNNKYKTCAVITEKYVGSTDIEEIIEKSYSNVSDIPFIKNAVTLTATDSYSFNSIKGKAIGLLKSEPVFARDFTDWASNADAEMRFWVKSEKNRSFILSLGTAEAEIKANINVEGNDKWREIILKRSDFSADSKFDNGFSFADTKHLYLNLYVNDDTLQKGESFTVSLRAEFYSGAVFQKGDANMDNNLNIKDLVRIKKLAADDSGIFINCDLNSDNRLTATDITRLRNKVVSGNW